MIGLIRRIDLKKFKYIIFTVIIIIIILIGAFFLIKNNNKNSVNVQESQNVIKIETIDTEEVTNSAMYFTVKSCVDTYVKYISEQNNEALYGILDKTYIEQNNINKNNILSSISVLEGKNIDFNIQEMRVKDEDEEIQVYYIKGMLRNENDNKKQIQLTVNIDMTNKVFTIMPEAEEGVFDEN